MENWRRLAPNWRKTPQSIIGADWRGKFYAYLLFYRNMILHPSVRYKNWLQLALIHQGKTVKNSRKLAQIGADWRKARQILAPDWCRQEPQICVWRPKQRRESGGSQERRSCGKDRDILRRQILTEWSMHRRGNLSWKILRLLRNGGENNGCN